MGKVEMLVLNQPLRIVCEDLDTHFTPYAVRSAHLSHDDMRRLRVFVVS
jgi:hypothetical protein